MQEQRYRASRRTIGTAAAGFAGGVVGFGLSEPYNNFVGDAAVGGAVDIIRDVGVWFALIMLGIGGLLAAADALINRDWRKAGLLVARAAPFLLIGGIIAGFIAQLVYQNLVDFEAADRAIDACIARNAASCPEANALYRPGRAIGWGVAGLLGGIPVGLAARSRQLAQNGAIGGLIGGLAGGAVFDSIGSAIDTGEFGLPRLIGVVLIGTLIGLAFSVITTARSGLFLEITSGDFTGTQFLITDPVMIVGCASNAAITIRGDRDIKEHHFELRWDGTQANFSCIRNSPAIEVAGAPITAGTIPLGSDVRVGRTIFRLGGSGGPSPGAGDTTSGTARRAAPATPDRPSLTVRDTAERSRPTSGPPPTRPPDSGGRPTIDVRKPKQL